MTILDNKGNTKLIEEDNKIIAIYENKKLYLSAYMTTYEGGDHITYRQTNRIENFSQPVSFAGLNPAVSVEKNYAEVVNGELIFIIGLIGGMWLYPERSSYIQPLDKPSTFLGFVFSLNTGKATHIIRQNTTTGLFYYQLLDPENENFNKGEWVAGWGDPDGFESGSYLDFESHFKEVLEPSSEVIESDLTNGDEQETADNIDDVTVGIKYLLDGIKDYDGNLHGYLGNAPTTVTYSYKFQGQLDVNSDGTIEAVFTNSVSGRWVTSSIDPITGAFDYTKHGVGGTTRIVGIYQDPLVANGTVEKDSVFDGSRTFINDLKLDNLILKTVGDYDSDGFQEVYWSKVDNTAYLRAVMHADGNIQYANYQNLDQMTDYLTGNGFADTVALIA